MSNILKQIRWQQRYLNLEKSYANLEAAVEKKEYSILERAGLIQLFETTFELAWKTIKDYLEAEGITAQTPRDVLKQAFAVKIITDGEGWLDSLDKRNILTHTYQEEVALYAVSLIKNKYFLLFNHLMNFFKNKLFTSKTYGFSLPDFLSLMSIFNNFTEINSIKIFGSRALGNFKPQSDVDLCLFGNINEDKLTKITSQLSELTKLPYLFDVVLYNQILKESLKNHIDTCGKIIYQK